VGVASYPTLSNLYVENKLEDFKLLVRKQLSVLAIINTGVLILFISNSENIITLIYQRGLFTGEDTLRVSKIFLIVSFGLIPWSINQIVTRSYYVQRNYWFPVWVGTSITLVTVILLKLNSAPTEANYAGIIISSLWLNMLVLTFFLKVKEERIVNKSQMLDFLKIFLVGTAVYFLTTAINIYSGNLIFEVIIDSLFILILIFLSLFLVKMKYVNLKRIR